MTQSPLFLLVEFYYPMIDDGKGGDFIGDACLVTVLQPLARTLSAYPRVESYEFMRYSLDGYHLRIKFHGERRALQRLADEGIRPALQTFALSHARLLAQDMTLGDFGQRLVARLGKQGDSLKEGGDFAMRMARDAQELFESARVRSDYLMLSRCMCDLLLVAIEHDLLPRDRRTLVRLMLVQLLEASGLNAAGLHYLATFAARQWQGYFNIDPAQIASCRAAAATAADRFSSFLAGAGDSVAIARALPARIRPAYALHMQQMLPVMTALVDIGQGGAATSHTALRLLSLVHLAHNRLGLNILQEIIFAELAIRHFATGLDQAEVCDNNTWVDRNLTTYLANAGGITL